MLPVSLPEPGRRGAGGVYGVLAHQVVLRTREIGTRMALGSDSGDIFRLILREGAALLVAGLILGLAGAFAIRRVLESQLFGVGATDRFVLGLVVAVLALVTLLACSLPARRAARVDPVIALGG